MGVSKVEYNNETLIDVSNDTVTPQSLAKGYTAHNSNGDPIVGTMTSGDAPSGSGSGIIDVTELPTVGIDENAVYRLTESIQTEKTEIYFNSGGYNVVTLQEWLGSMGVTTTPNYYIVDELPADMEVTDAQTFTALHVYITKGDGISYAYVPEYGGVLTLGVFGFQSMGYDNGFTENAYAEKSAGVYTTVEAFKEIVRYFVRENGKWKEVTVYINSITPHGFANVYVLSGEYVKGETIEVNSTSTIIEIFDMVIEDKTIPRNIYVNTPDIASFIAGVNEHNSKIEITEDFFRWKNGELITSIRDGAFQNCSFENATIPDTVCEIGLNSFKRCVATLVSLPSSIDVIPEGCFDGARINELRLPEGLKRLEKDALFAFRGKVQLPDSIEYIGTSALSDSEARVISLPKSLAHLDNEALSNSFSLESVTFNSTPVMGSFIFRNCYYLITINVPWSEGEVPGAPWGAVNATINYNYTEG